MLPSQISASDEESGKAAAADLSMCCVKDEPVGNEPSLAEQRALAGT